MFAHHQKAEANLKSESVVLKRTASPNPTRQPAWTNTLSSKPVFTLQPKLTVNQSGDKYEQEADRVATQVMRMPAPNVQRCACGGVAGPDGECAACKAKRLALQRKMDGITHTEAPPSVHQTLRSSGQPLDASTRSFMEPRFGQDFGSVRVHTDSQAAQSAADVSARAYTVGNNVVFGAGQYSPKTNSGKELLSHELAHTVQQSSGTALADGMVQRAPTRSIVDKNFVGPLTATQRRAAQSCSITCCDDTLGTMHAMPLFMHQNRGAQVAVGSPNATGVGAAMHFIANSTQPPVGSPCHCDSFRIIQVLETNDPAPGRGGNSYVDNNGQHTPFYSDVFLGGQGEHPIPAGYPDAGERLTTTESIYDRPSRNPASLAPTTLSWMAEAHIACVKNGAPDRILGGVTYGFIRIFNPFTHDFLPVIPIGPSCRSEPSQHFIDTLKGDATTSSYDFKGPPNAIECAPRGDFPMPQGDTRMA